MNDIKSLLPLLLVFVMFINAAKANDLLEKANKYYELKDFKRATMTYKELLEKTPNEASVYGKLANAYRLMNDYNNAAVWYTKAVQQPNVDATYLLQYGMVLKTLGKYDSAKNYFAEYAKKDAVKGQAYLASCNFAKERISDPALYIATAEKINTKTADYTPSFYKGKVIYASARNDMKNNMNDNSEGFKEGTLNQLFIANIGTNGQLSSPKLLRAGIKTRTNEAPVSFSEDGKLVAFTENQFVDGVRNIPNAGGKMRIYLANVKTDDEWGKPTPFKYNKPEQYNTGYPCLSPDGQTLYFASDMAGGQGGFDLYVCKKEGNEWGEPQNLGNTVNTAGDEIAPFIIGETLYFSSDFLPGLGGMDVFRTEKQDGKWAKILHLGTGINTPFDDYGFIYDRKKGVGYLTSNRNGNEDIFSIKPTDERIEIVVLDDHNRPIPGATIDFSKCGEQVVKTDANGRFKFRAVTGFNCEEVLISKPHHISKYIHVATTNSDVRVIEVQLTREASLDDRYIGTIMDAHTNLGLAGVEIEVRNMTQATAPREEQTSDLKGMYALHLHEECTFIITFMKDGYTPLKVTINTGDGENKKLLGVHKMEHHVEGRVVADEYEMVTTENEKCKDCPPQGVAINPSLPKVAYDVQIGIYTDPDVENLNVLRALGYVYSERKENTTARAYKVGAFKTKAEAENIKNKLIERGYKDAFVTKLTNQRLMSRVLIDDERALPTPTPKPVPPVTKPTPPATTPKPSPVIIPKPTPTGETNNTKPQPETVVKSDKLVYKLQLGAYRNPHLFKDERVAELGAISHLPIADGMTLILVGDFDTYTKAKEAEATAKTKGIQTVVVAIKDGQKVPIPKK
jgi:tetratricopeptide (TPR) repeat protein/cell division septation protein DedD